jgi:hypothetical protein
MNELAIHEAGHAIMCDALGVAIEFVSIAAGCEGEEASFEGSVKLKNECNPISDVMAATLAGPAASFFIAGVPPDARATAKYQLLVRRVLEQVAAITPRLDSRMAKQ